MVVRVFGRVDGVDVVFLRYKGNSWMLEFPKKLDSGNYIAEVYAEDEAGNVSYCCTLLLSIDPSGACIHVAPVEIYLKAEGEDKRLELVQHEIYLEVITRKNAEEGKI